MIDNQTKQSITEALKLLSDNNSSTRTEAVKRLGTIGVAHPQIIERLQSAALHDVSSDVRNAANYSLELLQPTPISNKPQTNPSQTQSEDLRQENEKVIIELLRKQNAMLDNLLVLISHSLVARNEKESQLRTRIVDVDITISSLANLMLKWIIASIPVGIIIFIAVIVLGSCTAILGR